MSDLPPGLGYRPDAAVSRPAVAEEMIGDAPLTAVWRNRLGGLTFGIGDKPFDRYLKWAPPGTTHELDLAAEASRLRWACTRHPVPRVLGEGGDDDSGTWLLTAALPGRSAVDPVWVSKPGPAVDAIAIGLRTLHDHLSIDDCPFDWSTGSRIRRAHDRLGSGAITAAGWSPSLELVDVDAAIRLLDDPPEPDPVVCHGDACAPNTLLTDDGVWSGHVDLSALGVGDRWADLAVASWSLGWNYGDGWEDRFFSSYGIRPDRERIRWFRALWDLT